MAKPLVSDELWRRLQPLLPKRLGTRHIQHAGRKPTPYRRIVAGILFVLRTGVPWRALPATSDFPCGNTCRRWLLRWQRAGVWDKLLRGILEELHQEGRIDWTRAAVDSAAVRAPGGCAGTAPVVAHHTSQSQRHHATDSFDRGHSSTARPSGPSQKTSPTSAGRPGI